MAVDDVGEGARQVGVGLYAVQLAGLDQGRDDTPVCGASVMSGEQCVFPVQGDRPDGAFDGIAVHLYAAIRQTVVALYFTPAIHKYYIVMAPLIFFYGLSHHTFGVRYREAVLSLATAICGFYRLDVGVYALASGSVYLMIQPTQSNSRKLCDLGIFLGAVILLATPYLGFVFISNGSIAGTITDILGAAGAVAKGLSLPWPVYDFGQPLIAGSNMLFVGFYVGVLSMAGVFFLGIRNLFRRPGSCGQATGALFVSMSVFGGLYSLQFIYRPDLAHLLEVLPVTILFLCIVSGAVPLKRYGLQRVVGAAIILLIFFALEGAKGSHLNRLEMRFQNPKIFEGAVTSWTWKPEAMRRHLQRDQRPWTKKSKDLAIAANHANANSKPGDSVAFLPFNLQFYFLSQRHFETPFGYLNPGHLENPRIREEFLDALRDTNLVYIQKDFCYEAARKPCFSDFGNPVMEVLDNTHKDSHKIRRISVRCLHSYNRLISRRSACLYKAPSKWFILN